MGHFWHSKRRLSALSMRTVSILTRCKWKGCSRSRRRKRSSEEPNVQHRDFLSLPALMEEAHLFSPAPSLPLSPILLSHPLPSCLIHLTAMHQYSRFLSSPPLHKCRRTELTVRADKRAAAGNDRDRTPLTFELNPSEPWIKAGAGGWPRPNAGEEVGRSVKVTDSREHCSKSIKLQQTMNIRPNKCLSIAENVLMCLVPTCSLFVNSAGPILQGVTQHRDAYHYYIIIIISTRRAALFTICTHNPNKHHVKSDASFLATDLSTWPSHCYKYTDKLPSCNINYNLFWPFKCTVVQVLLLFILSFTFIEDKRSNYRASNKAAAQCCDAPDRPASSLPKRTSVRCQFFKIKLHLQLDKWQWEDNGIQGRNGECSLNAEQLVLIHENTVRLFF